MPPSPQRAWRPLATNQRGWADVSSAIPIVSGAFPTAHLRYRQKKSAEITLRARRPNGFSVLGDRHDRGADLDAVVEVDDVLVQHADAAVGGGGADRFAHLHRRAVDGDLIELQGQRPLAHRVIRRAARDELRQLGMIARDDRRRRPVGADELALDVGLAAPRLAGLADGDRVLDGGAVTVGEIEPPLALLDDDHARRIGGGHGHRLLCLRGGGVDRARDDCCQTDGRKEPVGREADESCSVHDIPVDPI